MQPKRIRWRTTLVPGIGAILAILGAALAICWDDIFQARLAKELKLSPTSKAYSVWKNTPGPLYFDIYLFNWTNPEDITNSSAKPRLVELGPYRFRETKEKADVTWHDHNSTVSYRQLRRWYFDEEGSKGSLEDNVTTLNVVAASAIYTSRFWGYIKQKGVSMGLAMFHEEVSVTKTAGELLFDGYDDPLLDMARSLPQIETNAPPVDKFGWFYQRNGSTDNDGYFNMATGDADIADFGRLKEWNNMSQTPYFPGMCGKITGSAGEFYPPNVSKSKGLSMFSADLCRTITFDFEEVIHVKDIPAYKFSGGSSILDNGTIHEENKCFCTGDCQPSGVVNVSSCRYGSPAFISFPHFYLADPYYNDAVEGLSPDKDKHGFHIALEPMSGIPVDVAARFQLNILISPSDSVALYRDVPRLFMPILWFEQRVTLGDAYADEISLLIKIPLIGRVAALGVFVVGIFVLLWTPIKINIRAWRKVKQKKGPTEEAEGAAVAPDSAGRTVVLNNLREREALMPAGQVSSQNVEAGVSSRDTNREDDGAAEPLTTIRNITKE